VLALSVVMINLDLVKALKEVARLIAARFDKVRACDSPHGSWSNG